MTLQVNYVYILTKSEQETAYTLGCEILHWLKSRGIEARVQDHEQFQAQNEQDAGSPDLVLVLGGDGTMLSVARKMGVKEIPMLGLNLGQVGFLTELCTERWAAVLQDVLAGAYNLSPRILLDYKVIRQGEELFEGRVVNDLVVSRGGVARLARLQLNYGQNDMSALRADGLIISTPTGSTAYAVAAGGALLSPELEIMQICPICPFLSGFRSVVLSSQEAVEVEVLSPSPDMFLTQDGQYGMSLLPGDKVLVSQSEARLLFIQPRGSSYLQKLKQKGYL